MQWHGWLVAQSPEAANWTSLVSTVANVGFTVVVAWYLLTKAMPKMLEDFKSERKEDRSAAMEAAKERAAEFRESLRVVVQHCEVEAGQQREIIKAELGEVSMTLRNVVEALETQRDAGRAMADALAELKRSRA